MSNKQAEEQQVEEEQDWLERSDEELLRRPRRRLFGVGANPTPLALIGVLLIACGFIGGALVEKGQSTSSDSASSGRFASRLAALRSGGGGGAGGGANGSFARQASGGSSGSQFGGGRSGSAGATVGQVVYVSGHTLYVTNPEGNTVKVRTSVASVVNKTVKSEVKAIHPGETVIVTGGTGANGAINAESIRVGEINDGGGLGAFFGGGARRSSSSTNSTSEPAGAGSSTGGEPALFGK